MGDKTSEEDRKVIVRLLWKYRHILGKVIPGNVKYIQHTIIVDTDEKVYVPPYANRDPSDLIWLQAKAKELEADGLIEKCPVKDPKFLTQANAPPKKDADGKFTTRRFCVNFKALNKHTLFSMIIQCQNSPHVWP